MIVAAGSHHLQGLPGVSAYQRQSKRYVKMEDYTVAKNLPKSQSSSCGRRVVKSSLDASRRSLLAERRLKFINQQVAFIRDDGF
jgi:hypothetical protein